MALIALGLPRCYAHDVASRGNAPGASDRPAMIRPTSGRYAITRGDRAIGEETFTITSSASVWKVEGRIRLDWPVEQIQGYALEVDERSLEPRAFEVWIEILEERERVTGRRTEQHFTIRNQAISGERTRQVAYGRGTMIDFGSPLFNALPLSLLGSSLQVGKPVPVRTILITLPRLDAAVTIATYELLGANAETRQISVSPSGRARPTAMWVRRDGLPVRVRTWIDDGAPFDLVLK